MQAQLQRTCTYTPMQALSEDFHGFRARMESNFDAAIIFIKGDLEQLESRISGAEASKDAVMVEVRTLSRPALPIHDL